MKIVFFGTANVALPVLEALNKQHEIIAVVTSPDAEAGRRKEMQESPVSALAKDLKLILLKPEKVKNNSEFFSRLQSLNADIFVVVAYGKILPMEVINQPKFKTINVHFSLLPKYRGPSPIQSALLNGDSYTGTSVFILDENIDNGPLLAQQVAEIDPYDNYFTLSDKLARVSASIINSIIEDYTGGKITPLPQDESSASHTKIITKEDGKVNWNKSAQEINSQFRAFFLWPGIWTVWNDKVLKITDCVPVVDFPLVDSENHKMPGSILPGGIVACGSGTFLQIKNLQLAGKNEAVMSDFLNGYQNFIGSRLV